MPIVRRRRAAPSTAIIILASVLVLVLIACVGLIAFYVLSPAPAPDIAAAPTLTVPESITVPPLTPVPTAPAPPAVLAPPSPGASADSYVKFGRSKGANGDLSGAIDAFNQAITIDPKFAPGYENRGVAQMLQHKLPEAIADFNTAIQLDDKYQDAYYNRGTSKAQLDDFDGAIADFDQTIALNPKYASAFYNRGHAKYFKGDLDGALADTTQAIALESAAPTPSPYSFFIRGLVRHAKNDDPEGATSDFQQSATSGFPFGSFWLWIVQTEKGDRGIAQQTLTESVKKPQLFKPDDWPTFIANYLLENVSADQLLAKAKEGTETSSRLCEAWFYIGMSKHFSGDNPGAQDAFQQAIGTGSKDSEEYIEAQRQVAKLQPATP